MTPIDIKKHSPQSDSFFSKIPTLENNNPRIASTLIATIATSATSARRNAGIALQKNQNNVKKFASKKSILNPPINFLHKV